MSQHGSLKLPIRRSFGRPGFKTRISPLPLSPAGEVRPFSIYLAYRETRSFNIGWIPSTARIHRAEASGKTRHDAQHSPPATRTGNDPGNDPGNRGDALCARPRVA